MDIEFCPVGEKLEQIKNILAFPDVDDAEWIVKELREVLGVRAGMDPIEEACPMDSDPSVKALKDHVSLHNQAVTEGMLLLEQHIKEVVRHEVDGLEKHIGKKFAAVHRNIHSGDKVAKALMDLAEEVVKCEDSYIWKCPDCGEEADWDAGQAGDGGTPMCTGCDVDMEPDRFALFDTDAWKNAEAIVLRIKRMKEKE